MTRRKTLSEQILANRAQISGLAKLAGKEPPVFSELEIPKARATYTPSEAQVLKSILAYLRLHPKVGWYCRQNCGSFEVDGRYIQANSQSGMSDIIGCLRGSGRLFAFEVKSRSGRLSEHQTTFLRIIADSGGISGVVKSLDDVTKLLDGNI
jgi:hypothetical protein